LWFVSQYSLGYTDTRNAGRLQPAGRPPGTAYGFIAVSLPSMKPIVRFRVDFTAACSLGPGKIDLLESIQRTGSLRQAAQALGMSYRRAWLLLDGLNRSFTEPASTASIGGQGGGGVTLTPFGLEIIRAYRAAAQAIESAARQELESIASKAIAVPREEASGARRKRLARSGAGAPEQE
jgi:molybdate transport system regulatory protein